MERARWLDTRDRIFERKGDLVFRADLPGLSKDDVKVEITDTQLTIEGQRKEEKAGEQEKTYE